MLSSPVKQDDIIVTRQIEAYDLSQILIDDKFFERFTISEGTSYIEAVNYILNSAGINKINIQYTEKVLPSTREFEIGITKLSAINKLLGEINYNQLIVDEYGYFISNPYKSPSVRPSEYTYKDDSISVLASGMIEELDLFSVPNAWIVVVSNPELPPLVSTYVNENPDMITINYKQERRTM